MKIATSLYIACSVLFVAHHVSSERYNLTASGESYIDYRDDFRNIMTNVLRVGVVKLKNTTIIDPYTFNADKKIGDKIISMGYECASTTISGFSELQITRAKFRSWLKDMYIEVFIPRISATACCRNLTEKQSHDYYVCDPDPAIKNNVTAGIVIEVEKFKNEGIKKVGKVKLEPKGLFSHLYPLKNPNGSPFSDGSDPATEKSAITARNAALTRILRKHFSAMIIKAIKVFRKNEFHNY